MRPNRRSVAGFGILVGLAIAFLVRPSASQTTVYNNVSEDVAQEIRRLSSADAKARADAASRLGRMGGKAVPAVPYLVKLLTDYPPPKQHINLPVFSPADEALRALIGLGRPAVPLLLESLNSDNEETREWVANALGWIRDPAAKPKLLALWSDSSPYVRGHVALAIGRIGGADTVDFLLTAIRDHDAFVTEQALYGIGLCKDPRTVEPLLALLQDPSCISRGYAAQALGTIGDNRAVGPLVSCLKDRDPDVRWHAAYALGGLGSRECTEPLSELLLDPMRYVQIAATRSLVKLGGTSAYNAVAGLFHSSDGSIRRSAADELAQAGRVVVPTLVETLRDQDPQVQECALRALKGVYGEDFDSGGKEWFLWLAKSQQAGDSMEIPHSSGKPAPSAMERRELTVAVEFRIPKQVQLLRFLVTPEKVIASVRYETGRIALSPLAPMMRTDRPPMVPEVASALVAWSLSGKLLWRTDLPLAYHLVEGGRMFVLAYDGGNPQSESGLVWVDADTGKEIRRVLLPGRPAELAYNKMADSLVMILYPQEHLPSLPRSWMEVRAYRLADGKLAWKREEPTTELYGFSLDSETVVIGSFSASGQFIAGLDPTTGQQAWRKPVGRFPCPPKSFQREPPRSMQGLVYVPFRYAHAFIDPASGQTVHGWHRPESLREPLRRCGHVDRLYYTPWELNGPTLACYDFPSGKQLWADATGTVCYGIPVAWGQDTVFLTRQPSKSVQGQGYLTELRIYSPQGKLLYLQSRDGANSKVQWNDIVAPVSQADRLYVADTGKIVALKKWKWW